ncbi:hypothetical protein MMAD_02490 [Mycolicibacterium madagascariense]|uniref:DUF4383 domain-containing protein n=1 Tax=Mycolicibacterium madagascariense TaxID=212765 RepID=A0A7I7X8R9_9MYCO|nr:DUF4383 domain-containing protein [Mycolicibacterium madagascariense]MCV7015052.1 DUF4383 domain-containing protein [Mycolicibacterium madagascariense]BBZ25954.1 hypothetical protein MMAD_02490 [Mycolicibacterium madagascariense]
MLVAAGVTGLVLGAPVGFDVAQVAMGLAGGWWSRGHESARTYLVWGSAVYVVAFLAMGREPSAHSAFANTPGNWLHLAFALLMVVLGVVLGRHPRPVVPMPR